MANTFEITLDPDAFVPDVSLAPDRGLVQGRPYWAFDASSVRTLRSKPFVWPAAYDGGGTLKCDLLLIAESATSGKFDFEISVEAITPADAVDLDAGESFDTANTGDGTVPGTAGHLMLLTITLTNKDSVAAGDLVRFKIERDADDGTNDTATGDARLLGVRIYEEAP